MKNTLLRICIISLFTTAVFGAGEAKPSNTGLLLDPVKRQDAWKKIIEEVVANQQFEEDWMKEDVANCSNEKITHVLPCPQQKGGPMYAVFFDGKEGTTTGGFELISSSGKYVFPYAGNNVLPSYSQIQDLTGDGVLEIVVHTPINMATSMDAKGPTIEMLSVIPVTPAQKPILTILFNCHQDSSNALGEPSEEEYNNIQNLIRKKDTKVSKKTLKRFPENHWFWRLTGSKVNDFKIELGPIIKETFASKVELKYSLQKSAFLVGKGVKSSRFQMFKGEPTEEQMLAFSKKGR